MMRDVLSNYKNRECHYLKPIKLVRECLGNSRKSHERYCLERSFICQSNFQKLFHLIVKMNIACCNLIRHSHFVRKSWRNLVYLKHYKPIYFTDIYLSSLLDGETTKVTIVKAVKVYSVIFKSSIVRSNSIKLDVSHFHDGMAFKSLCACVCVCMMQNNVHL